MGTPAYLPSGPAHGQAPDREGDEYVLTLRERGAGTGRAAAIFPRAQQLNLTALNYEIAHQGVADLRALEKAQWRKPFVAGVIDVKSLEVDQVTDVADRIRACLEVVPADMLGLTTDCGLINMPRQIAQAKLRALVEGARLVRAELGAAREELLVG
jgi:5-methyltetrahydropteroyltriglutamate--homocysteine methyltransferase